MNGEVSYRKIKGGYIGVTVKQSTILIMSGMTCTNDVVIVLL